MGKSMFLVAALLAVAAAYPLELEEVEASTEIYREPILIVKSSSVNDPEKGIYSYSFEGANGIILSADGQQKQIGEKEEEAGVVSKGSYSYQMDGMTYTVDWVADENGFRASGEHLPTPPPMPEHVVRLLADLKLAEEARAAEEAKAAVEANVAVEGRSAGAVEIAEGAKLAGDAEILLKAKPVEVVNVVEIAETAKLAGDAKLVVEVKPVEEAKLAGDAKIVSEAKPIADIKTE